MAAFAYFESPDVSHSCEFEDPVGWETQLFFIPSRTKRNFWQNCVFAICSGCSFFSVFAIEKAQWLHLCSMLALSSDPWAFEQTRESVVMSVNFRNSEV